MPPPPPMPLLLPPPPPRIISSGVIAARPMRPASDAAPKRASAADSRGAVRRAPCRGTRARKDGGAPLNGFQKRRLGSNG
eukprot:6625702-Prymnesium_polylepis.2